MNSSIQTQGIANEKKKFVEKYGDAKQKDSTFRKMFPLLVIINLVVLFLFIAIGISLPDLEEMFFFKVCFGCVVLSLPFLVGFSHTAKTRNSKKTFLETEPDTTIERPPSSKAELIGYGGRYSSSRITYGKFRGNTYLQKAKVSVSTFLFELVIGDVNIRSYNSDEKFFEFKRKFHEYTVGDGSTVIASIRSKVQEKDENALNLSLSDFTNQFELKGIKETDLTEKFKKLLLEKDLEMKLEIHKDGDNYALRYVFLSTSRKNTPTYPYYSYEGYLLFLGFMGDLFEELKASVFIKK